MFQKRKLLLLPLIVLFTSISFSIYAQKRVFQTITRKDGLSHSTIYSLVRDQQGFMWFGTGNGLNRYDGYRVTQYFHDPGNANSLSSNNSGNLYIDRSGIIWIGTWGGGLNSLDPRTMVYTRYLHDPANKESISDNRVQSIYRDRAGVLWAGTRSGGLNRLNVKTGKFRQYLNDPKNPNSISSNRVWSITEDKQGILWIGTNNGLNRFDPKKERFTHYFHVPGNVTSLSHSRIRKVYMGKSGYLWVGTQHGLNRFDRSTGKSVRYYPDSHDISSGNGYGYNVINAIYEDPSGTLWVGAANFGLGELDPKTGKFIQHIHNLNDPESISHNDVRHIMGDPSGILWLGTRGGGVNMLDLKGKKFTRIQHQTNNKNSLSGSTVISIFEDPDGILWLGTQHSGLNRWDRKNNQFTHYQKKANLPGSIQHNMINHLHRDRKGRLWIASPVGLGRLEASTNTFSYITTEDGLTNNDINSIFEDSKGILWLGMGRKGLNRLDPETKKITPYEHVKGDPNSLSDNYNVRVFLEEHGKLWVGTQGGLNLFDPKSGKSIRYKKDPKNPKSLSNNMVHSVNKDQFGRIWVGTFNGLNLLNRKTDTFTHFGIEQGLPSNLITGVLESNGDLWIATSAGLSRFNMTARNFRNYGVADGLQGKEFVRNSWFKGNRGELFFGGTKGANAFFPASIKDNPHPPEVVLTDFKKFNKSVSFDQSVSNLKNLELSYKDKFFSFEFAALDYTSPIQNQYAYKMEGFDRDWIETDSQQRRATYTNLDGGIYTFRVKASNNDGVWNEEGLSLEITVDPPPWKTWWAYTLYLLTILCCIFGYLWRQKRIHALEMKRVQDMNEILEAKVKERTAAIRDLMDNTGQGFLSFGQDYKVHQEYSKACKMFLGGTIADKDALQLLFAEKSESVREMLNLVFGGTGELHLFEDMLPDEINVKNRTLSIGYRWIVSEDGETKNKMMVILTDVTRQKALEAQLKSDEERNRMIIKIAVDREGFLEFLAEIENLFQQVFEVLEQQPNQIDPNELFRYYHTIKGGSAGYALQQVSTKAHAIESNLEEYRGGTEKISPETRGFLTEETKELHQTLKETLDSLKGLLLSDEDLKSGEKVYKIKDSKIGRFEELVREAAGMVKKDLLIDWIQTLKNEPIMPLFKKYASNAEQLAEKLNKNIKVELKGENTEIAHEKFQSLFSVLIHLVRNSVDHGLETSDIRQMLGKAEQGTLTLEAIKEEGLLKLYIIDDGGGIDGENLKSIATSKGIITEEEAEKMSEEEAIQLIFAPGFSSKEQVSDISGRGVGMDAVRAAVEDLNGKIYVKTVLDEGSTFELVLPL